MSIGEAIKAARRAAGLTQAELAQKLGVTPQTVSQYERGLINPKIETLQKFADALGVDAWNLSDPMFFGQGGVPHLIAGSNATDETRAYIQQLENERARLMGMLKLEQEREKAIIDQMIDDFQHLNNEGQTKAAERVRELTEIARYRNERAYALDEYKAKYASPDAAGPAADDAAEDEPKE